ncbi:MAG: hypothetical protein F6J95_027580 [Leptolyngbya sp. SIO1E4]|nr:hypothetical protein [Leptolyngbya sp. SIO1E4]
MSTPLPDLPIRDLARQIAHIAHCSLATLYKYPLLWKNKDPLAEPEAKETPVTGPSETVLSDRGQDAIAETDPPESREIKALHTEGGGMKCEATGEAPLQAMKSLPRGVRGDLPSFPQGVEADIPAPIPFDEVHAAIQRKVSGLNWSLEQIRQFLAEHFQGRSRIRELEEYELTTYLYYLATEATANEPAVCSA